MIEEYAGLLGFLVTLILILLRVPVAVAMGTVGLVGAAILSDWNQVTYVLGNAPFEAISSYGLSVVPLFIFMGVFAAHAGLSQNLYNGMQALLGHLRGGLAIATIGACAAFGAICGSSLATAATMSKVALPEMQRHGYPSSLAAATIAAGGTLGVLIPPSIIIVIYALLTQQSIGALFAAALIPGILGTLLYIGAITVLARKIPFPSAHHRQPWSQRFRALVRVWDVALLFLVVIGGIYAGLFSPTEAAAVGASGTFLFALVRKKLNRHIFFNALTETATTTGMIFLILIGAALFNYFIETSQLPQRLVLHIEQLDWPPFSILLLLLLIYLILGCFMDSLSMMLLTVPIVFPLITALGYDPIWFGIIVVTVVELGLITPPVGMNLFIIQGAAPEIPLSTIVRGIVPFIMADIIRMMLLVSFPSITLWLPKTLGF
ncbi:MAG: TRAP transporter large permease [Hydrogenophilus thermoluteolus]